jgi:hypothetical protein
MSARVPQPDDLNDAHEHLSDAILALARAAVADGPPDRDTVAVADLLTQSQRLLTGATCAARFTEPGQPRRPSFPDRT